MSYYKSAILKGNDFNEAIELVTSELKKEGFGIVTEIDITATFKKKLNVDFKNYRILGACSPSYAHHAIQNEDKIGVFLPCNVIVQQHENGEIEVSAVDPIASMMSVKNENLGAMATEIQEKLFRVISNLG